MIYYHYTAKEAYKKIKSTNEFKPSFIDKVLDGPYGPGWYFTDLRPDKSDEVLYELWNRPEPYKVGYFIEFRITKKLENCRDHVYKLENDQIPSGRIDTKSVYYCMTFG